VSTLEELHTAISELGLPAILKTRRFGYDGKGQAVIREVSDAEDAFAAMNGQPAILEAFADFTVELSIIAARGLDGEVAAYPLSENRHSGRHSARKLRSCRD
jgi:5-(carboxyamino)imidazole ribonucleotide synthase